MFVRSPALVSSSNHRLSGFAHLLTALLLVVFLISGAAAFLVLQTAQHSGADTADENEANSGLRLKGVALSPKSFEAADFRQFLQEVDELGEVLTWTGDWLQLADRQAGAAVVAGLASQYGYQPAVLVSTHTTGPSGRMLQANRPLTETTQQEYLSVLGAFLTEHPVRYLGIGVEVNRIAHQHPAEYEQFVALFDQAVEVVRATSPQTRVFTVFQLEEMKGLRGGLFGGVNEPAAPQWQLLDDFSAADMVAFTTYPYLIYQDPEHIPADYYEEISSKTSMPIAVTEMGWPSQTVATGYESDEAEQARFINRFAILVQSLPLELAIWPFVYDQDTFLPFATVGLSTDQIRKSAWNVWRELQF